MDNSWTTTQGTTSKRPRNHDTFSSSKAKHEPPPTISKLNIQHMQHCINIVSNPNPISNLPTMVAAMGFSSSIFGQTILPKITTPKPSLYNVGMSKLNQLQQAENCITPQLTYTKNKIERKSLKLHAVPSTSSTFDKNSLSPAQTIMQFYTAINEKNLKQLDKLIADDCFLQDYTFPKPFQGKKEVLHFLEQLTMCIGEDQNMQFNVEHICEGNDYTAVVNWHLDWKKIRVPFTRGCSFYSLSANGDNLVIEKAQVLIEPPIKLGVVALTIFKIVCSLFDAFPAATEWFLQSPHIMFCLLLKAYNIVLKPLISPFLAWYIKLLNFVAFVLSFTLKILYYLAKMFHM